jgi:hypothetical protein
MKDYMPLAQFGNHETDLQSSVEVTTIFTSNSSARAVPKNCDFFLLVALVCHTFTQLAWLSVVKILTLSSVVMGLSTDCGAHMQTLKTVSYTCYI